MFCTNCGNKNENNSKFCLSCGTKTEDQKRNITSVIILHYYSRDWSKKGILGTTAAPRFDLMADDKYFYLLKLPKFKGTIIGSIVGLLFLSFVGLIIGNIIGTNSDFKKRKHCRSTWVDFDDNMISDLYNNNIFLKIPLSKIKTCLTKKSKKLFFTYEDIKIVLKNNKNESAKFDYFFNKYVL